jgi:hypothetical protein
VIPIAKADAKGGADEQLLARDMIDVHGTEAATVARDNARTAALDGQKPQARSWIRVLGIIQQRGTDTEGHVPAQRKDGRR